jgi:hypothetical protein
MLSKKSFLANERNLSAPLVRPMRSNVRDHIELQQNDHRPSYMPCRGLGRPRQPKPDLCEIFGAPQISTFSTASTLFGSHVPTREVTLSAQNSDWALIRINGLLAAAWQSCSLNAD